MNLKYTLLSVIFLIGISLSAQSKKPVQSSSEILVHGTSSLHDWTSNCQEYSGSAVLKVEDGKLTGMSDLNLQIVVKGIKSGKSAMDNNTYKAMFEEKHPNVSFKSKQINLEQTASGANVSAKGTLTIAGVSKEVTLKATASKRGERWVCSGRHKVHTPDYGVERVSAMMGTIKTGEDVEIEYDIVF